MKVLQIKEVQTLLFDLMKEVHDFLEKHDLKYYLIGGSALGAFRHDGFIPWDDDIDIGMFRDEYEKFLKIANQFDKNFEIVNFKNAKNCDFGLTRVYFNNTLIDNPSIKNTRLDKRLYFDIFPLDNVPNDIDVLRKFEKKILKKKKLINYLDLRIYEGNNRLMIIIKRGLSLFLSPFRNTILTSFDKLMRKYEYITTERVCSLCSQYSFKKQVMLKTTYGKPTLHKFESCSFYIPENIELYLSTLYGPNYMEIPPEDKRRKGYDIFILKEE